MADQVRVVTTPEEETAAIAKAIEALEPLDMESRKRAMHWLSERLGLTKQKGVLR